MDDDTAGVSSQRWPLYEGPVEQGRSYLKLRPDELVVGTRFDTEFEQGCVVTGPMTENGSFDAVDSDGVECQFNVLMVVRIQGGGSEGCS